MEETETNARVDGGRRLEERICEPREMEDRGPVDSPVLPVNEARAVETMAYGRFVRGVGWVWFGDRLAVEI